MKKKLFKILIVATALTVSSCNEIITTEPPAQHPITFAIEKSTATDANFTDGEKIGVYVAARTVNSTPAVLKPTGNTFDNELFTVTSAIPVPKTQLLYPEGVSMVDIFSYAPYQLSGISTGNMLTFSVESDQKTLNKSDLLWSTVAAVNTTQVSVPLKYNHKLSKINIKLTAGVGVTLSSPTVKVNNTLLSVKMDMATGVLGPAEGTIQAITSNTIRTNEYRTIIIPQTVSTLIGFITITNGSKTYKYDLPAAKTFASGDEHTYDIIVNSNDLTINITGSVGSWNDGGLTSGEAS